MDDTELCLSDIADQQRAPNQVEFRQDLAYEDEDGARLVPIEDDTHISDKPLVSQRRPRDNPRGRDVRWINLRKAGASERVDVLMRFEDLKKKQGQLYMFIGHERDEARRNLLIARRDRLLKAIARLKANHPHLTGLHPE